MPTVLRLVYSRFATHEIVPTKSEAEVEAEEEVRRSADHGYMYEPVASETNTSRDDRLTKGSAVEV